jgi:putative tricarboxylic transport membrane protein
LKKALSPQLAIGVGTLLVGVGIALGAIGISSEAGLFGGRPELPAMGRRLDAGVVRPAPAARGAHRRLSQPRGAFGRGDRRLAGFAWVSAGILLNAALITTIGFILSCALCFVFAVRGFKAAGGPARLGRARGSSSTRRSASRSRRRCTGCSRSCSASTCPG